MGQKAEGIIVHDFRPEAPLEKILANQQNIETLRSIATGLIFTTVVLVITIIILALRVGTIETRHQEEQSEYDL